MVRRPGRTETSANEEEWPMQVPAPFDYRRATSVDDALGLLAELGDEARVVAGGHSLLPMMKLRLATPSYLIEINDLADLAYIRREGDEVRIGALTRHRAAL
jgi:aerobic carbon-monoxide dehydrogenase medium subunit